MEARTGLVSRRIGRGMGATGGQLTFTPSRTGGYLYPGDTWTISIAGASPNKPVTSSGQIPSGYYNGTALGTTDASGNFNKSGTIGNGDLGSWLEGWYVDGVSVGNLGFTVLTTPAVTQKSTDTVATPVQHITQTQVGHFTFTTSRGFISVMYPGDTWNIKIGGASPIVHVTMNGHKDNGPIYNPGVYNTDANGNFTLSGTVGVGDIGSWQETWYVNGIKSGSISFVVAPAPAWDTVTQSSQVTPQASGMQTGNVTNTTQDTSGVSPASNQTVFGLFGDKSPVLFGVVNEYTALGIAAAVVLFMMTSRR